jgi:hypothetical protein
MRFLALAATVLFGLSRPALCDSPKPEPLPAAVAVQAYGGKNPDCLEWSDGCVTCARGGKCSTPGIACQPTEILCKNLMK